MYRVVKYLKYIRGIMVISEIEKNTHSIFNVETILISSLVLTTIFQLIFFRTKIGMPFPDPYFHIKNMTVISLFGIISSILFVIYLSFIKKGESSIYVYYFSLIMIFFNLNFIPLFSYKNDLYTDTYIFIGELFYLLKNQVFGWGHAEVTPGLSLISGQISLISNIDYITISKIMLFIFPLMMIFFIYFFTKEIINNKIALFASLAYVSSNWMNHIFHFNRQSIGLVMQVFLYYIFWMIMKSEQSYDFDTKNYIFIFMLSFISLTLIHSLSSLMVLFNLFLYIISTIFIKKIIRKKLYFSEKFFKQEIFTSNIQSITILLFIISSITWLSWSIYTQENFRYIYQTVLQTIDAFSFQPNPIDEGTKFIVGYTSSYYPIIITRTFEAFLYTFFSILIFIYICIYQKIDQRLLFLVTWFGSSFLILPTGLWTGYYIERAFLHLFPVFAVLVTIFLLEIENREDRTSRFYYLFKNIGRVLLFTVILFTLLLPITKYSNTPFMYPPSVYLDQNNFLGKHGIGLVAVLGESSVTGYSTLLYNRSNLYTNVPYNSSSILDIETIMVTFRAYTRGGFVPEIPIYDEIKQGLDKGEYSDSYYSRVYDADKWHRIYRKYSP